MAVPTLSSKDPFQRYRQQLTEVASHQRHGLYQALERLAKRSDDLHSQDHVDARIKFEARLQASLDWVQNRANLVPDIEFPPALPIVDKRTAIAEAIEANPVVIIAGETGSGKTTQLPKICLTLGRGVRGAIAHTQPRRIAARSVASRIAEELKTPLGGLVGYQVRFDGRLTEQTAIRLMTDGILLAEIQRDRYLSRYDTLIIDEAHERSLNIDFLLGYIKQLLPKRPDLKVIVTSATIDVEKFSRYFNDAPILSVSGRVYPVDVIYRPLADMAGLSMTEAIADCVQEICATDKRGDILIFLPGERDIREAALQLRRLSLPHLAVVPLYSRLSLAEQNKIFQAHSAQRVVLSTNVAETSLTVPGITYVIDPGYARISRYSHRTKIQRLPIEAISQASANQRKGRCGRQSEGVCFRLYSEEDFLSRPKFTDPEILRTDLSAVILQMTHLKLGDVRRFSFIDHPDDRTINGAYKRLQELQAVNEQKNLTDIGRQLVRLPLDPGLARILLAAEVGDCLTEIIAIVSALAIQDPRERPADKQQAADQAHRQFWHEASDFLFWLNLWREYHQQIQQLSNNQLQKWCHKHYLAPNRMREWRDIHRQIVIAAKSLSLRLNTTPAEYAAIHTALLSGLLGNIASKTTEKDLPYQGARNRRFSLHPGSSQYKKGPRWILAGQLIETNRLYAHTVALIEPQWLISVAGHLLIYRHDQPHYQPHSGQVMAYEQISLYGLVVSDKKRVSYAQINLAESRELFIRAALVEGEYAKHPRMRQQLQKAKAGEHFFLNQQRLIEEITALEAKSRKRDILVDDEILFDFYDRLVPAEIVNLTGFEHWRKHAEEQQKNLLHLDKAQLMLHQAADVTGNLFPDHLEMGDLRFRLVYQFDPVHRDDGVTLRVPVSALPLLSENRLQWLVPGFLAEKITALIKALPKTWRKKFAPVPATVAAILPNLKPCGRALVEVLAEQLFRHRGVQVPASVWGEVEFDDFYRMNIHIVDERGTFIDSGRDLPELQQRYRSQIRDRLAQTHNELEQQGLKTWSFGALPETYQLRQKDLQVRVYPGLKDRGDAVDIHLFDNIEDAAIHTLGGSVRLALLSQAQTIRYLKKHLLRNNTLSLSAVAIGDRAQVIDDIITAAVRQTSFAAVNSADTLIRREEIFQQQVKATCHQWVSRAEALEKLLLQVLSVVVEIKKTIKQSKNALATAWAAADIQQQLDGLFYQGFLYETLYEWFAEYPRYLQAILIRLEKVPRQANKDRVIIEEIESLWLPYRAAVDTEKSRALFNRELICYRWMIEEFRVSEFAQILGTRLPVSLKRLKRQWELC